MSQDHNVESCKQGGCVVSHSWDREQAISSPADGTSLLSVNCCISFEGWKTTSAIRQDERLRAQGIVMNETRQEIKELFIPYLIPSPHARMSELATSLSHPIVVDAMYTERKVDRQGRDEWDDTEGDVSLRFSSPIYAEEPSLISTIAVKRERDPTPPATARPPRPHKFRCDHWSPPSEFKPFTNSSSPPSTQQSSAHITPPSNLYVKVEVDVQNGHIHSMREILAARSQSAHPRATSHSQSIPCHPARDNACSPKRIINISNDSNGHSTTPHPQQYHFRAPARSTTFSSRSPRLRNSSTSSRRKRDIAVPHGRRVKTSHDPRNQQNGNTNISLKENAETLEDLLSSSERVLNPEEVYESPTSQLRNEFFSQSIHESLYVTKWKDAFHSVEKLGDGGDLSLSYRP
ncbi:hypothetical protein V865_004842 [Kwoniella europaea PYCC6329]|uniref:Uncharacterized protein n=1 Tax=Kwoniella europaea PYCC6329 TaxID=1423913 RepID=A0AAX4KKC2_9TREE